MVGLGFLSQGAAYGMTYGMAGTFIGPASAQFHASRTAVSLAPAMVALLHGLLGPLVGFWLTRRRVGGVLCLGALVMASAFALMHFATSIWMFSLGFGVLGGVAVACLGVTAVTTLVGRWFPTRSGRAMGLANMPILVTLLPPAAGYLNVAYGWRTTALVAAAVMLALAPILRLAHDPPTLPDGAPLGNAHGIASTSGQGVRPSRSTFRPDAAFWLLALAVGIFDGSGITIITHVIPLATESGIDYEKATLLVSVMGVCGMAGAPILGYIADRMGGAATLAVVALALIVGWAPFLFSPSFAMMAAAMSLLGFCGGAFAALLGTSFAPRYRGERLGPAIGLAVLLALPFNFLLPLVAAAAHDATGSYRLAMVGQLALLAAAFLMLGSVARADRKAGRAAAQARSVATEKSIKTSYIQ